MELLAVLLWVSSTLAVLWQVWLRGYKALEALDDLAHDLGIPSWLQEPLCDALDRAYGAPPPRG